MDAPGSNLATTAPVQVGLETPVSRSHADRSGAGTIPAMSVSVVLEWENMAHAAKDRPRQTLASLKAQADALYERAPKGPSHSTLPVRLSEPLEVLLPYNCNEVEEADLLCNLSDLLPDTESVRTRLLPVSGGTYCLQKNAGAAAATGDLVIFLDSDVTPEPTWLAAFMRAFLDPRVHVAVGNTYVDIGRGDAYSRAMALSWMFPLREPLPVVKPSTWFYANNVAFRKAVFRAHQFPHTPGLKHHPAALLVQQLKQEGITLWYVGEARGHHPAPNGLAHFFSRGVAAGRARILGNPPGSLLSVLKLIRADIFETGWYCKRILREGSKVELRSWQIPVAFSVTVTYYALRLAGSLATYLVPGLMRDKFEL